MVKPILKTEKEYEKALAELDEIWRGDDTERLIYLSIIIEEWESVHYPMEDPEPIGAIEFNMDRLGLDPCDLMEYIGDIETVHKILNREEVLTEEMIAKLSVALDIPIDILTEKEYDENDMREEMEITLDGSDK